MVQLDALPHLMQQFLFGLELFISIPSLFAVGLAVYIIKTSTKWPLVQRLIGFNYLLPYYLYTTLRVFDILITLVNRKPPTFDCIDMLLSGTICVGIGNCLLLALDRRLTIRWSSFIHSTSYTLGMAILSLLLWTACYLYQIFLYVFKVSGNTTLEMVHRFATPVVGVVIVIVVVIVNRLSLKDVEKKKEGLREMVPEEQAIMREKLEINMNISLVYKPVLVRLLVAAVLCVLLQFGATTVECFKLFHTLFYLTCAPVVSTLLSSVFYNVVAITPPLMLHATLHHRDNIFLLQRFEDFCETLNKLAVRKKGRSTIYELQPNTNTQPITSVREELFRQETERQSNHFYTLTHYWRHPNPMPPGTIVIPENGP